MNDHSSQTSNNASASRTSDSDSPEWTTISAGENGLIMEADRPLDIGSTVIVGFHVDGSDRSSQFVCAEMIVVDSKGCGEEGDEGPYRISMIFSNTSDQDRSTLIRLAKRDAARAKQPQPSETPTTVGKKAYDILQSTPKTSFGISLN